MTGKGSKPSRVILSPEQLDPALPARAPGPLPPKDILHDIKYSLLVADQKYFFTSYGPEWFPHVEHFRGQRYTSVLNGDTSKSLHAPDVRTKTIYAVGFINHKQGLEDARGLKTMPLLLHVRPFSAVELDAGAVVATGQRGEVNKRECQIVGYEKVDAPGRQVSYWIDTERDCCVLRLQSVRAGRTELQLDIE